MARIIQTADLTPNQALLPDEAEWVYNGLDCGVTLEVLQAIAPQLDNTTRSTYEFSKALQAPVLEMSMRGLLVNRERRDKVLAQYREEIERIGANLTTIIRDGIGLNINWRSPVQLRSLMYDVLGLKPIRKRNANGQMVPTVNREALERLSLYFIAEPICSHLLALRDLDKKRQFLETKIDADGRIRCNFNIAGTNTGRLASSMSEFGTGTNLQNVDRDLRSCFIADEGMIYVNLDLEQADARNVGAICWNHFIDIRGERDAGAYLDACESGDLHTTVCRMAWTSLPWPEDRGGWRAIADEIAYRNMSYRDLAKRLGHGTNFYGTPPTMARHTKVDRRAIEDFQRAYFSAFPCIGSYDRNHHDDNWHNRVRRAIKESASITTLLGRRRFFFGRHTDDETIRAAIAYEPQSMTADEIDTGIIKVWRGNRVWLMLQVHDSLLIQCRENEVDEVVPWALEQLRTRIILARGREFAVPVEAKVGWNWGDYSADNPDGLVKWKGSETRKRQERPQSLSALRL